MKVRFGRHAAKLVIETLGEALESKDRQHRLACDEVAKLAVDKAMNEPNVLAQQLMPVLQRYSGERGDAETAEQTLLRIVRERDEATKLVERHKEISGRIVTAIGGVRNLNVDLDEDVALAIEKARSQPLRDVHVPLTLKKPARRVRRS